MGALADEFALEHGHHFDQLRAKEVAMYGEIGRAYPKDQVWKLEWRERCPAGGMPMEIDEVRPVRAQAGSGEMLLMVVPPLKCADPSCINA